MDIADLAAVSLGTAASPSAQASESTCAPGFAEVLAGCAQEAADGEPAETAASLYAGRGEPGRPSPGRLAADLAWTGGPSTTPSRQAARGVDEHPADRGTPAGRGDEAPPAAWLVGPGLALTIPVPQPMPDQQAGNSTSDEGAVSQRGWQDAVQADLTPAFEAGHRTPSGEGAAELQRAAETSTALVDAMSRAERTQPPATTPAVQVIPPEVPLDDAEPLRPPSVRQTAASAEGTPPASAARGGQPAAAPVPAGEQAGALARTTGRPSSPAPLQTSHPAAAQTSHPSSGQVPIQSVRESDQQTGVKTTDALLTGSSETIASTPGTQDGSAEADPKSHARTSAAAKAIAARFKANEAPAASAEPTTSQPRAGVPAFERQAVASATAPSDLHASSPLAPIHASTQAATAAVFRSIAHVPAPPAAIDRETGAGLETQIVQAMKLQWGPGAGDARIRLQPHYLGDLTISLRVEQGRVTAELAASTPEVRQWIESNEALLRQGLAQHDLKLERLVVTEEEPASSSEREHQPRDAGSRQPPKRQSRRSTGDATFEVIV